MSESFAYDNLLAGCQKDIVQRPGTVRLGEAFSRGSILGRLTATGKWQEAQFSNLSNFSDVGIAVEAIDTTSGETNTTVYIEGEFNENHVIFFYGDTADTWRETLMTHGLILRKSVNTSGY